MVSKGNSSISVIVYIYSVNLKWQSRRGKFFKIKGDTFSCGDYLFLSNHELVTEFFFSMTLSYFR